MKSIEDLRKIREEMQNKIRLRNESGEPVFSVFGKRQDCRQVEPFGVRPIDLYH